jgi:hypothetical protein
MKGKYYENRLLGSIMERMGTIPTVSRGYIIAKDFREVTGRVPTEGEYNILRKHVESESSGGGFGLPGGSVPGAVTGSARDMLGRRFDPLKESYAQAVNGLFVQMMEKFVSLHERSFGLGLDLLVYPEGTRSKTLLSGKPGIGQIALHFEKYPIWPVGCSGSDRLYPGSSIFARRGRVVYRFGKPITHESLKPFHTGEVFTPFTPAAEMKYKKNFQGVADLVMGRIDELVDPEYRSLPAGAEKNNSGASRFI